MTIKKANKMTKNKTTEFEIVLNNYRIRANSQILVSLISVQVGSINN